MLPRIRLDTLVFERGLAETRTRACALIMAGQVLVDGMVATKAGVTVSVHAEVSLTTPDHPYVGRGGVKLAHALDRLNIVVRNRMVIDIGASTGGFTDVLLQRGATSVAALDVGHGQLAWKLRQDPRVVVLEGINARLLSPTMLPIEFRKVQLITIDVSFISLRLILKVVPSFLRIDSDVIALLKPQFEAGKTEVGRKGVITDPQVHHRVIEEVLTAANEIGLERIAVTPSPITGAKGNKEFFLHMRPVVGMPHSSTH